MFKQRGFFDGDNNDAGSEAMREMLLARDLIPGYSEHLKDERFLQLKFSSELNITPEQLAGLDIAKQLASGS